MGSEELRSKLRVVQSGHQNTDTAAEGLVEWIPTPTINPADALTEMRVEDSLRRMLVKKLEPYGVVLSDATAKVIYTGVEHRYTLAKGPGVEFAILQIPRLIIGNDNNMGTLLPLGSAFAGATVRIVSQKQEAPAFGLRRVFKDWRNHYDTRAQFVAWSYIKNLNEGKFEPQEILELDLSGGTEVQEPAPEQALEPALVVDRGQPEKVIRIFLASSEELRTDRDEFDLYFRQQNDRLRAEGFYLEVVRWENFLDAMSERRLQDEYNEAVRDSDIFVSLFMTKTGRFTEEEFDTAHQAFLGQGRPVIYTFFKSVKIDLGDARRDDLQSLWKFQDRLKELGHFWTQYDHIEHLKRQFRDQLDRLLDERKGE